MGVYIPYVRLPSAYQEVEYIESSGTQYIDTGYILTSNPGFDIDFAFLGGDSNSWIPICGARNNYSDPYGTSGFCCLYINSNSKYVTPNYAGFDPGTSSGLSISSNVRYNIVEDAGQFYIDGVYKSACSTTNTYISVVGRNFLLFANNDSTGTVQVRNCQMKLYGCKLYNNGTLVRDFIPCYRKSDNVIGLYDLVNDQFYTNSGSGTFSKGDDITAAELKNAYIGEYIPTSGLLGYRPLQSDLKDVSGNGKDGSWYSGTGSFGTIGNKTGAVVTKNSSNYTTQHIITTLNYAGPTVTLCGRVYYNSMNSDFWNAIMTNTSSNTNFISLSPRPAQSNKWSVGGNGNILTTNSIPSSGSWYFVVGILTSSGKKIYINGTLVGSDSTGFTTGQGTIWRLGCGQMGDATKFGGTDGYVRHCAVYNRELTADEILKYYNLTA